MNLRELGLNLIPCIPRSKFPAIKWGEYKTKKYEGELAENNAVICGVTSGNLVVIDLDDPTLADLVFKDFEGLKKATLVVKTGKKGYHVYFKCIGQLPNTLRITHPDGRHLDIQSQGAYVIAPESIHPETGNKYTVVSSTYNIIESDINGLITNLRKLGFKGTEGLGTVDEISMGVKSGNRNNAAFKYSCGVLKRLELNKDMAWAEIQLWNERCTPPLPKEELESVFKSAYKRVTSYPLQIQQNSKKNENVVGMPMRSISSKDEGKEVIFEAFIASVGEYKTVGTMVTGICPDCQREAKVTGDGYVNPRLPKCSVCKIKMNIKNMEETTDMVELTLQELQEEVKNNCPIRLMGRVIGENVVLVYPGQKLRFTGTFKSFTEPGYKENEVVILIKTIEEITEPEDICMSDVEIQKIKPLITMESLIKCVAPDLYGLELPKEILLITLVGGEKIGTRRGEINTIFVGNPSMGKSELLKFAEQITPNSSYVNGKSSSGPGLVYAMVKMPDGTMRPQAGVMVTNKFVFLDEFDKMHQNDMYYLLEVMEQHTAHLNKGGSTVGVRADATVLTAANPKLGKWENDLTIKENLNVPEPILSRMDWIVGLIKSNSVLDSMIADHILGDDDQKEKPIMNTNQLKHYLNYARKLSPKATKEAREKLKSYYIKTKTVLEDGQKLPMESRQLIGFFRSAIARNKLLLKDIIDENDADEIIKLHRRSLESLGLKVDGDTIQSVFEDSHINKDKSIFKTWHKCMDEESLVSKEAFFKTLMTDYPRFFADIYSCQDMFEKGEGKRFLLQPNGKYRMSLSI